MSGLTSLSVSGTLTATTVNATSDIQVNGTSYNLTQLDRVNVTTIGTAQASKALVLDANRSASNIYNLIIDPNGTGIVCSTLKFWNAAGTASNTLAHMYYVGVQEGGATASQAVVLNSTKDYSGIRNLSCSGTLTISTSIATPSITCDTITKAGTITLSPTTLNLNPTTLQIAGTAVTATAAELNAVDVTAGAAAVSKALVLDSSGSIGTITKMTCTSIRSTTTECQITAGTALDTSAECRAYPLCITNDTDTVGSVAGISFMIDSTVAPISTSTPSAVIAAVRTTGAYAVSDLRFYTRSGSAFGSPVAERIRLTADGNFGIGSSSPPTRLSVVGDSGNLSGSWQRVCNFANDNASPITGEIQIVNAATGASSGNGMWFGTTTSDPLRLGVGNSTVMYLNSSSRLGVGLSVLNWSPEATIHAGGWIYSHDGFYRRTQSNSASYMFAWAGVGYGGVGWDNTNGQRVRIGITNQDGTWAGYPNSVYGGPYTNGSNRRLKTDIRDCPHGLSTGMQMRPRLFRWKSSEDTEPDSIGFIAQELQPLVPEVVSGDENCPEDENGMIAYPMGIEMASITAVLWKAIQELTARVEDLEHKAIP
ncbi:hypothetical protein PF006_g23176 [Phytophthora fragariae]|uniref:Peptidase S74 domain-containing protein n=1 Tax=Phytophthora fragariae TaxID=53985 RepID=A0A6A3RND3_9STRA|nr:hypothetical protein PF011_g19537 [Phytophthora fragariae]KAE9099273.1 hypothetical protein PF006_g23176 [Phytophthora fragariae]KAE9313366.1 hypothetical protein PF008_g19752 [Phytophthora fragariae]